MCALQQILYQLPRAAPAKPFPAGPSCWLAPSGLVGGDFHLGGPPA
jgi:hypothetical protein